MMGLGSMQVPLCLFWLWFSTPANALHRPDKMVRNLRYYPAGLESTLAVPPGGAEATEATVPKQGAYGKIKIHKEPFLLQLLLHPDELVYAFLFVLWKKSQSSSSKTMSLPDGLKDDLEWCDGMLGKVSRSFSAVIRQLPHPLQVDVMVFYLVLRALDTIEDDTWTFANNTETKVTLLQQFHQQALQTKLPWSLADVGEGDEKILLQNFPRVQSIFQSLSPESQIIIADITKRMADGMAETVGKDLTQGTVDVPQYNLYCHYVAGLVGEGLSRLFAQSKLEESHLADQLYLSDQMGLFLQKTNILRDYLEDYVEGRTFWPQSIWKKHSNGSQDLGYFTNQTNPQVRADSLRCLNELITDALVLVPDCLAYLGALRTPSIFRFCAIPQVMAMATLSKCYANCNVFTGVVKIRRGLSVKLIFRAGTLGGVQVIFRDLARSIERKAHELQRSGVDDPSRPALLDACARIQTITAPAHRQQIRAQWFPMVVVAAAAACHFVPQLMMVLLIAALLNYIFGPFFL